MIKIFRLKYLKSHYEYGKLCLHRHVYFLMKLQGVVASPWSLNNIWIFAKNQQHPTLSVNYVFLKDLYNRVVGSVLAFGRWECVGVRISEYACTRTLKITIPNGKKNHTLKMSKKIILKGSTVGQEQQKLNSSLLDNNDSSLFKGKLARMRIPTYT